MASWRKDREAFIRDKEAAAAKITSLMRDLDLKAQAEVLLPLSRPASKLGTHQFVLIFSRSFIHLSLGFAGSLRAGEEELGGARRSDREDCSGRQGGCKGRGRGSLETPGTLLDHSDLPLAPFRSMLGQTPLCDLIS